MDMPEVKKCCGLFPPKYATFFISLFGLASGGLGVAGIIIYGIAEEAVLYHFLSKDALSEDIKKTALMTLGVSSLLLLVANALLFIGVITKSPGALSTGIVVIFSMCLILLICAMIAPVSCFFLDSTCIVKKVSSIVITLFILSVTVFLEMWLYFMTVAWNHQQELGG